MGKLSEWGICLASVARWPLILSAGTLAALNFVDHDPEDVDPENVDSDNVDPDDADREDVDPLVHSRPEKCCAPLTMAGAPPGGKDVISRKLSWGNNSTVLVFVCEGRNMVCGWGVCLCACLVFV